MNKNSNDLLESCVSEKVVLKKIHVEDGDSIIRSVGQCGEKCPDNGSDHRGACYLDFGHSSEHKCSVDGKTW